MKKIVLPALAIVMLASCGNAALDGNAKTDTTNFPTDTGGTQIPVDTANHVNTNTGTYPGDTMNNSGKADVRSSTAAGQRTTTPGNNTQNQH